MIYLESLRFKSLDNLPAGFPFEVPVIETLDELHFTTPVTFLVGENGSGKSTLLETIACGLRCPTIGSSDVEQTLSGYARDLATGAMQGQKNGLKRKYGENPDARSH